MPKIASKGAEKNISPFNSFSKLKICAHPAFSSKNKIAPDNIVVIKVIIKRAMLIHSDLPFTGFL